MGTAMVFPGMGPTRIQDVGRFLLVNPDGRRLIKQADTVLGHSVLDGLRQSADDYSADAQVAFLVTCLALAGWAERELGVTPQVCTGASFGVKPALAYAGALPADETIRLTARLADTLTAYFAVEHTDVVTHSFVRTPAEQVEQTLADLRARGEWGDIACHVDRDLFMVTLREGSLPWLRDRIRAMGGLSLYTMRPPMHSPVLAGLRQRIAEDVVSGLTFADPVLPVIDDQDGAPVRTGAGMRDWLLDGVVRPLRWPVVVEALRGLGVDTVCVAGPDSLFSRVACTREAFTVVAAGPQAALRPRRAQAAVS